MTYQTSVPAITYAATGLIVPTESAILSGALADQAGAFGAELDEGLTTPQGQYATSLTAIIASKNSDIAYVVSQFNPLNASGRWQDALGQIYFQTRIAATATVVNCLCTGGVGVIIPAGSLVQDESGNLYASNAAETIGAGGNVPVEFQNQATGPIACPANTVTSIYKAQPGWDTVNNPTNGAVGRLVESQTQYEARRQATVAKNSINMNASLRGAMLDVANVVDCYVIDNPTSAPVVIQGQTIGANCLYVCVAGGAEADIANTIWRKKPPGIPMTGNTTTTVQDTSSGYAEPYPQYSITYQIPTSLPINFNVYLANSALVPANAVSLVQAAIASAFVTGFAGNAQIGAQVLSSSFYSAIESLGSWVDLIDIELSATQATFSGTISGTLLTVNSMSSGLITAGSVLAGTGVTAGTTIVSNASGTGGAGTYNLSVSQTEATLETMTTSLNGVKRLTASINQEPVLGTVTVTLES